MTKEAFLSLLLPMQERLFRTAYRILLDEEEAKDIVQDVFIKLWKKKEELETCKSVEAWCITITKNTVLDKIKYNKYRITESINTQGKFENNTIAPINSMETKDLVNITRRIINDLPERQRLLVHLRDVEGLDYSLIAKIMKLTIGEVKIGLFRARKTMREKIKKMYSYGL